ncbi:MAG: single-stranded-DNA-specific exonuclease RecJ [Chitinispirillales bacterium]|jgi:single-stranded-DNA-specific exonuclease|nr:single-stranded-DNA-specific exonuclease RecJ [Chitinispirillales bacterium]
MNIPAAARERISIREIDSRIAQKLAAELNVSQTAASILAGRKLATFDQCKKFFRPSIDDFHDPFLFKDMEKAVSRIKQAVDANEKIIIYGDYDVDGVTSTVLLVKVFKRLGADCGYYLPNRLTEGYGVSDSGIHHAAQTGASLIITVDCGITAHAQAALASSLGIDLIITDHHEPKKELPRALAIINPIMADNGYPDKSLAGVGTALKLCQALGIVTERKCELWQDLLELAALGTAADIVPLTGENRVIASLGFSQMRDSSILGLRALIDSQGLTGKKLSTSEVVFQIAPCINAVGRLGDPGRGVELLLTEDPAIAALFAKELREANLERRALDNIAAEEAAQWVEANLCPYNDFSIVAASYDWHVGVIGIVASRMAERFCRPSILFSLGEDGMARGSGRSAGGMHLLDALSECSPLLESYGGHGAAAGLQIRNDRVDEFREKFNIVVRGRLSQDDLVPRVTVDAEVPITSITSKLLRIIKQMEPFGPGNMRPVLLCRDLKHRYAPRAVGQNQNHLKLSLTSQGVTMDAIAFNFGERIAEISESSSLDVAFSLEENEWNGKVSLQMNVKGVSV